MSGKAEARVSKEGLIMPGEIQKSTDAKRGGKDTGTKAKKTAAKALKAKPPKEGRSGLAIQRYFTTAGADPFNEVQWELRTAAITGESGKVYFEQKDVEIPKSWSLTATNVVVQKYFRGKLGTPQRESSVRQLVDRVASTITDWGKKDGYFAADADGE